MAALLYVAVLLLAQLSSSVSSIVPRFPPQAPPYPKMDAGDKKLIKQFISASNGSLNVPLVVCDDLLFYCFPNGRIKYIYLSGKELVGPIPPVLGQLTTLKGLFLQSNQYTGNIPATFAALLDLQFLHLETNRLYGNIPTFLTKMTSLVDVSVSYNLFSGTPPAFPNALTLQYQDNYFSGMTRSSKGLPLCDKIELNCLFGTSLPADCPYFKQRKKVHCKNFCDTTQAGGACGGNGVCNLAPKSAGAYCTCNTGFNNRAAPFTCIKN